MHKPQIHKLAQKYLAFRICVSFDQKAVNLVGNTKRLYFAESMFQDFTLSNRVSLQFITLRRVVLTRSHVYIFGVDAFSPIGFSSLTGYVDCTAKDRKKITRDSSASQDEAFNASLCKQIVMTL